MSEHHHRQGPYSGQPSHLLPHPPFAQSPSSFNAQPQPQPPYYGAFQQPSGTTSNFAVVNNSFQYNASNIPGLGMGSSLPPAPYRTESNIPIHSQPRPQPQHISAHTLDATSTSISKQRDLKNVSNKQRTTISQNHIEPTLEEGELSEGEFDDLYEPEHTVDIAVPTRPSRPLSVMENENGSVGDADGSSIYDGITPQGDAIINSTSTSLPAVEQDYSDEDWEPSYQERERSGSYSPYLSPREIQRKMSVSKPPAHLAKQSTDTARAVQTLPGINMSSAQQLSADAPMSNGTSSVPTKHLASPFHSVAEAKKKAQEAILGLWPLKVRYQDYIDEGFDERLIKSLFMELGLEASIPKPAAATKGTSDPQTSSAPGPGSSKAEAKPPTAKEQPSVTSEPSKPVVNASTAKNATMDNVKAAGKTAAEERKDKIARKLAAKAQKTVVAPQTSAPTPPSQSTQAPVSIIASVNASPAKPKTRAENNAILHQKLAALKKAQEKAMAERRLAGESLAKPATPPVAPSSSSTEILEAKNREESSTNSTAVIVPALEPNRRSVSTEKSLPRDGTIPGLSVVTQSPQPTNRSLKRPVASDFDSYSNPLSTLKRTRTQETLIIDVSDDEDIEMDIASPTDEPTSPNEINLPPRQTPLGAFPPLSESLSRKQRSSPGSSIVPTPPVHGAKLDLLHRRIEETKRMIAEAEAKKAAKKIIVPQSPQTQLPAIESSTLPKVGDKSQAQKAAKNTNVERRLRIRSYELPAVEASLKETKDQLRQAMAQTAQLELQILEVRKEELRLAAEERRLAEEERRLAEEAEQLEDSAEQTPIEVNQQATAGPEVNHVIGAQISKEQQPNSDEATDVLMTDREDISDHEEVVPLSETQSSTGIVQSDLRTDAQLASATRLSQGPALDDESRVEASIDDQPSRDASVNIPTENNDAGPDSIDDISEIRNQRSEHAAQAVIIEESTRDPSPRSNNAYKPPPPPTSHARDTSLPRLENSMDILPPSEQSIPPVDEQPSHEVINETRLGQSAQEPILSAPDNQSGEVQKSSSLEHLLLTSKQDEPKQGPRVEDLLSYHSPLGYFRAYRFHPKYFDEVAGGLKSMTYSSRIDPMRPLCPHVLAGDPCPDGPNCVFQHFESMVLPDAEIITQLGSADMFTGETRNRFIEGLKKVLNELKANKVKDFDRITKAIVKHRQEFLEDKSKVLPLDAGTS